MRRGRLLVAAALFLPVFTLSACNDTEQPLGAPSASPAQTLITPAAKKQHKPAKKPHRKMVHSVVGGGGKGGPSRALLAAYAAEAQQQFDSTFGDALATLYSDITIRPRYPNGLEIVYVYQHNVSPASVTPELEQGAPVLKSMFENVMAPELRAHGLLHPTATYTYRNPDGSLVWSRTFG